MNKKNEPFLKWYKKEICYSFMIITIISFLIILYGYLFKFQDFVYSSNKIVGSGLFVFLCLSVLAVFVSLFAALDNHYVDEQEIGGNKHVRN